MQKGRFSPDQSLWSAKTCIHYTYINVECSYINVCINIHNTYEQIPTACFAFQVRVSCKLTWCLKCLMYHLCKCSARVNIFLYYLCQNDREVIYQFMNWWISVVIFSFILATFRSRSAIWTVFTFYILHSWMLFPRIIHQSITSCHILSSAFTTSHSLALALSLSPTLDYPAAECKIRQISLGNICWLTPPRAAAIFMLC